MEKIVNLMSRDLFFKVKFGKIRFPGKENSAELIEVRERVDQFNGIPVNKVSIEVRNLPDPQDDTAYIVTPSIARRYKERRDLYVPDEVIAEDEETIGCKALTQL